MTEEHRSLAVRLSNVSFSYVGSPALRHINLDIYTGAYLGVLGPNGSGKTTLAYIIAGILTPTNGTVDTVGNKKIGLVLTNPENQIVSLVVEDDVAFGPENQGLDTRQIFTRVVNSLAMANCSELRKSLIPTLSGGQVARVAFAGQLAMDADIIILDEGTALMDPEAKSNVLDLVTNLNSKYSKTIIHISHRPDDLYAADEVVFLLDGEIKDRAKGIMELSKHLKDTISAYIRPGPFILYRSFLKEMGLGDMDARRATYELAGKVLSKV